MVLERMLHWGKWLGFPLFSFVTFVVNGFILSILRSSKIVYS
jgi:hypothetical protein